jgi:hypothetical protein
VRRGACLPVHAAARACAHNQWPPACTPPRPPLLTAPPEWHHGDDRLQRLADRVLALGRAEAAAASAPDVSRLREAWEDGDARTPGEHGCHACRLRALLPSRPCPPPVGCRTQRRRRCGCWTWHAAGWRWQRATTLPPAATRQRQTLRSRRSSRASGGPAAVLQADARGQAAAGLHAPTSRLPCAAGATRWQTLCCGGCSAAAAGARPRRSSRCPRGRWRLRLEAAAANGSCSAVCLHEG